MSQTHTLHSAVQFKQLTAIIDKHTVQVTTSSNGNSVVSHNRTGYEDGSPSPGYGGSYQRS